MKHHKRIDVIRANRPKMHTEAVVEQGIKLELLRISGHDQDSRRRTPQADSNQNVGSDWCDFRYAPLPFAALRPGPPVGGFADGRWFFQSS